MISAKFFSPSARGTEDHWRRALGSFLGRWLEKAQVRRPVRGTFTRLRSEGNEGAMMPFSAMLRSGLSRVLFSLLPFTLLIVFGTMCQAASIRGVVTDVSGAKVTGAIVDRSEERRV